MELITYRKTLDVHKGGVQFTLRGFETVDKISRVIEISLMASGDTVDFPLERIVAMMYVTPPGADEPSINECAIVDNKIVYNVLPIAEEGITKMKLKLIETGPDGARKVLATPTFEIEVINSGISDEGPGVDNTFDENHTGDKIKPEFTALENFIAKAEVAYGKRLERIELDSQCIFKAYYADGTTYETDVLQKLFMNGNVLLSESFAHGGTGIRAGEDTDNSMYYSNVAKSEALNAKSIMENSEEILSQVRQHGTYTAFQVNFNTGEVEYVSPRYTFDIDKTTGELKANEQTYTFIGEIERVVTEWLASKGIVLEDLRVISEEHTTRIEALEADASDLKAISEEHTTRIETLEEETRPIEKGGTGADNANDALVNLGILNADACDYRHIKSYDLGEFWVSKESGRGYGFFSKELDEFDPNEYDELIFVLNGFAVVTLNDSMGTSCRINGGIAPKAYSNTQIVGDRFFEVLQPPSYEGGWVDQKLKFTNCSIRCLRSTARSVTFDKTSITNDTTMNFVCVSENAFKFAEKFVFFVDVELEADDRYDLKCDFTIDVYGRKTFYRSIEIEEE